MAERRFIGRQRELDKLKRLIKKKSASLVVIRGRRRIGKSRLIREFGLELKTHMISGLPPTKETTRQGQLDSFATQLSTSFGVPLMQFNDWHGAFWQLGQLSMNQPILIALDEISWMGSKDPDFLGHLKNAWDLALSNNSQLILILCGSVSSWIEDNILKNTGFVGRLSLDLKLQELPVDQAVEFWNGKRDHVSSYEILKLLSVTGGVPRYLEEIDPSRSAEANIQDLCFDQDGLLFHEFDQIFFDLFANRTSDYAGIVQQLAAGTMELGELATSLGKPESTTFNHLHHLTQAGFVSADAAWHLTTTKSKRFKKYRLSDNYLRFYFSQIVPKKSAIEGGRWSHKAIETLPNWNSVIGLAFENLVINNVDAVISALNLSPSEVVACGPYFQRPTKKFQGTQIDLLIQSKYRVFYICEIKFSTNNIGLPVAQEALEKERRIHWPKGWSRRRVLIHVNGVTSDLAQSELFDHTIDLSTLIEGSQ